MLNCVYKEGNRKFVNGYNAMMPALYQKCASEADCNKILATSRDYLQHDNFPKWILIDGPQDQEDNSAQTEKEADIYAVKRYLFAICHGIGVLPWLCIEGESCGVGIDKERHDLKDKEFGIGKECSDDCLSMWNLMVRKFNSEDGDLVLIVMIIWSLGIHYRRWTLFQKIVSFWSSYSFCCLTTSKHSQGPKAYEVKLWHAIRCL